MNEIDIKTDSKKTERTADTILVVDDTPTNLAMLFEQLRQSGFKVLVANEGEMALLNAERGQPDLILLDIMMPKLDGFEICRRLKTNPQTQDIPVIFMTALNDIESKIKAFETGGVDYVTKPIQYQETLARVTTHLTIRKLQKALQDKIIQLEEALAEVKTLSGLLPICANCKKIRDDGGYWQQVEVYIENHSHAEFTHGICPDCARKLYPELYDK